MWPLGALFVAASLGAQDLSALLPGPNGFQIDRALSAISKSRDKAWAAPLSDILSFIQDRDTYLSILLTLEKITGSKFVDKPRQAEAVALWVGEHEEIHPPPGYAAWKFEFLARLVDPRYRDFTSEIKPLLRPEEIQWGGVKVDGIPALLNPRLIGAAQAGWLDPAEPVFGVSLAGDHRAYPLRILDWHEMANDIVGGKPVALAYCTLCGAGILYDASSSDGRRIFGSSGLLYRSNKLMYDRETRTLWNHLTGEPVHGPLTCSGARLPVLPMVLTSWAEWRARHPDTRVVDVNTGFLRDYRVGSTYGSYFASPGTMFPVWQRSRRLPMKARIFALRIDGLPKAYPLDAVRQAGGVVNDTVASTAVVVISSQTAPPAPLPERWRNALARHGVRDGAQLSFKLAAEVLKKHPGWIADLTPDLLLAMPVQDRLMLLDDRTPKDVRHGSTAPNGQFPPDVRNLVAQRGLIAETRAYRRGTHTFRPGPDAHSILDDQGRAWKVTEEALVTGDLKLPRLPGHLAYWFGWYAFFPRTEVFSPP